MVSTYLVEQANSASSTDALLTLATISHSSLVDPIRCVLNNENVISRGNVYTAYPFEFVPQELTKEGMRPAHLRIGNVDGRIVETLRRVAGTGEEPVLTFEFVFGDSPDVVERFWPLLIMQNARYADAVEGDLVLPDLTIEPVPGYSWTPRWAPGLVF